MSTSIIMSTTFTIATIFDVQVPVTLASTAPVETAPIKEADDFEITACMLNALPRCGLAAEKHCGHKRVCAK